MVLIFYDTCLLDRISIYHNLCRNSISPLRNIYYKIKRISLGPFRTAASFELSFRFYRLLDDYLLQILQSFVNVSHSPHFLSAELTICPFSNPCESQTWRPNYMKRPKVWTHLKFSVVLSRYMNYKLAALPASPIPMYLRVKLKLVSSKLVQIYDINERAYTTVLRITDPSGVLYSNEREPCMTSLFSLILYSFISRA